MKPSIYQQAVYDHVSTIFNPDSRNLNVQAVAGSGKTTTIVEAANRVPYDKSLLFVAFNRHIADSLATRLPINATASTLNSVGWRICLQAFPGVKLDKFKTENIYATFCDMQDSKEKAKYMRTKFNVARLVSLLKANFNLNALVTDVQNLAEEHGIDIEDSLASLICRVYRACNQDTSYMDFDDQIFIPLLNDVAFPKYDLVMVDEAQDLNPVMIHFIKRLGKKFICVGDSRQAIYAFRGADPKSMQNISLALNSIELPLSICYRCPASVVKEAQKIVPHILPRDNAPEGLVKEITKEVFRKNVKTNDYILCRVTAPLVSECLKCIKDGRRAIVKGRDIGTDLSNLVDKISKGKNLEISEFVQKVNEWATTSRARMHNFGKTDQVIKIDDQADTLMALSENCLNVQDIKNCIARIFQDTESTAVITFCTVHRSKGLEAENIYILSPELMPHPKAKTEAQRLQEDNLKYVAITRSLQNLFWVK